MSKRSRMEASGGKKGSRMFSFGLMVLTVTSAIVTAALFWSEPMHQANAAEAAAGTAKQLPEITVYKSPTCGCCTDWEEYLERAGFKVVSHERNDMNAIKKRFGVKPHLASCHTGVIDGYVIEGHVPADDIKRLLKERPKAAGLTAPGMPQHSPGMQPPGERPRGYNVLIFDEEGRSRVYSRY